MTASDEINCKLEELLDRCEELSDNQKKILAMLSERSREVWDGEKEVETETVVKSFELNNHQISTDSKPSEPIVTEQMLMDLTEVTVIAQTGKAVLVLKKGYQKWIPYSQLYDVEQRFEDGEFLQNLPLNEKAEKWMHNKPWDKYKAVKNR